MFLCFPDNFDFQKGSTPKTTSQVNENYALSVCYPCWPPQVAKIQFSNTYVFWKKGKQGLTNQAKYFLMQPCFKNKNQHLPLHTLPPLPRNAHSVPVHSYTLLNQTTHGILLMHSSELALPESTLQFRQHKYHTLFTLSGS